MTRREGRRSPALLIGLLLAAPGCEPPVPAELSCEEDSDCPAGTLCDPGRGLCRPVDAGAADTPAARDGAGAADRARVDREGADAVGDGGPGDLRQGDAAASPWRADAGPDQQVALLATVTLSAAGSTLPADAGAVAYRWRLAEQPAGSQVQLSGTSGPETSFTALDPHGRYLVELRVQVDGVWTPPDQAQVEVLNSQPQALAGADRYAYPGDAVDLDGSASSDADGDPLVFRWSVDDAAHGSLQGADTAFPTFQSAAGYEGSSVVTLGVVDGHGGEAADTLIVYTESDLPPRIEPMDDLAVGHACSGAPPRCWAEAELAAAISEPEGQPLTVAWSVVSCPDGAASEGVCPSGLLPELDSPAATETLFHVEAEGGPPIAGRYLVEVEARDSVDHLVTAQVAVTVENAAPTAQGASPTAGHSYGGGTWSCAVPFDVAAADADGDPLVYSYLASPAGEVVAGAGSSATLVVTTQSPGPAFLGPYQIAVTVDDGQGGVAEVEVVAQCLNQVPQISSLQDHSEPGHLCQCASAPFTYIGDIALSASVDDADGDRVDCLWSVPTPVAGVTYDQAPWSAAPLDPAPGQVELDASASSVDSFEVLATHQILLTCSDGFAASSDSVAVTFSNRPPLVEAGQSVSVNHSYLSGSGSYRAVVDLSGRSPAAAVSDPDQDPVTFRWSALDAPAGVSVSFAPSDTALAPTVTIDGGAAAINTFTLELRASDAVGEEAADTMTIAVQNRAPVVAAGDDMIVDHAHLGGGVYRSVFSLGARAVGASASDPDGDPVTLLWTAPGLPSGVVASGAPSMAVVNPTVTIQGNAAAVGAHTLRLAATDALGAAGQDDAVLTADNRPPVEVLEVAFSPSQPTADAVCRYPSGTSCDIFAGAQSAITTSYTASFSDPDNDPVQALLVIDAGDDNDEWLEGNEQQGNAVFYPFVEGTLEASVTATLVAKSRAPVCGGSQQPYYHFMLLDRPGGWWATVHVDTQLYDPFMSYHLDDMFMVKATNPAGCY